MNPNVAQGITAAIPELMKQLQGSMGTTSSSGPPSPPPSPENPPIQSRLPDGRPTNSQYDQSWVDNYYKQDPATQAAMRSRFGGQTQQQIEKDWSGNIAPQYAPGTDPNAILSGKAQNTQAKPMGDSGPPGSYTYSGYDANSQIMGNGQSLRPPPPDYGGRPQIPPSETPTRDTGFWDRNPGYTGSSLNYDTSANNYHGGPYSHEAIWEEQGKKTPMAPPSYTPDRSLSGRNYRSKSPVRFG